MKHTRSIGGVTGSIFALILAFLFSVIPARSAMAADDYEAQSKRVGDIGKKLLAVIGEPDAALDHQWPPDIILKPDTQGTDNAGASLDQEKDRYKVEIFIGLLEGIGDNDDQLAFIVGHELAHILLGHVDQFFRDTRKTSETKLTTFANSREDEFDADKKGMELAVAAGYSFKNAVQGIADNELPEHYTILDNVQLTHPIWSDRLAELDNERAFLWRAYSAFQVGVILLASGQYEAAEQCFLRVTREFPDAYEAHINLGYTRLMLYTEDFTPEQLEERGIGEITIGFYYSRSTSIDGEIKGPPDTRGSVGMLDEDLWWSAVSDLREGLRLYPESALGNATLAVSYLLRYDGKDTANAAKYFDLALQYLETDPSLDSLGKASVYLNAAAANVIDGDPEVAEKMLLAAQAELGRSQQLAANNAPNGVMSGSIIFHRANLLAQSENVDELQSSYKLAREYLVTTNPNSVWWKVALSLYQQLCERLGVDPDTEEALRAENALGTVARFKSVYTVVTSGGKVISLSDMVTSALDNLGEPETVINVIGKNSKLNRYCYPSLGVDIIGGRDYVLAIIAYGANAPEIKIEKHGQNADAISVKPGAAWSSVSALLGDDYDFRKLTDDKSYQYYRNLGLAFRVDRGNDIIDEIVIAQLP